MRRRWLRRSHKRFDLAEDWPKLALASVAVAFLCTYRPRLPDPVGGCPSCGAFVFEVVYGLGATSGYENHRLPRPDGTSYTVYHGRSDDVLDGG